MPDFSCYFRVHNRLDIDLQLEDDDISWGYWEKKPNDGRVPAFSVSDEFQIKDKVGPNGTEGKMYFKGSRGDRKITVYVYVTCPWAPDSPNAADCTSESAQLLCSVSGLKSQNPEYHPVNVRFIIDRLVK